jgi:PilZ domain
MLMEVDTPQSEYSALRRWPRYQVDIPLRLITQQPRKVAILPARGTGLNGGGMTIFAGVNLAIGEFIGLEFVTADSGELVRLRACVRNREGFAYGVEFIAENEADSESVRQIETILKSANSLTC